MTRQQKIWKGFGVVFFAVRPLFLYLFLPGFLMTIGMLLRGYRNTANEFFAESGNFYTFLSIILILFFFYRKCKKAGKNFGEDTTFILENADWKYAGNCFAFGGMIGFFLSALITVVWLPNWMIDSYSKSSGAIFEGTDFILTALSVGFFAPVTEEIIFRGYMLNRLMPDFTEKTAILLSAGIFALCHANFLWMIYAFCMGIFLAWLAIKKDNILYSVCVHIGFNLPSIVVGILKMFPAAYAIFFANPFLIALYGMLGGTAGILLYRQIKKDESI